MFVGWVMAFSARAAEAECHTVAPSSGGSVGLYADPVASHPLAEVAAGAELWVFRSDRSRWQVWKEGPEWWVDASAVGPRCPGTPPVRSDALIAAAERFLWRHDAPGVRPILAYVSPDDEADARATLSGRWTILSAEREVGPLAPEVVAAVVERGAVCAATVRRAGLQWTIEPVAGWCFRRRLVR